MKTTSVCGQRLQFLLKRSNNAAFMMLQRGCHQFWSWSAASTCPTTTLLVNKRQRTKGAMHLATLSRFQLSNVFSQQSW
eukprot:10867986-Karenia_brevis.AAC.1